MASKLAENLLAIKFATAFNQRTLRELLQVITSTNDKSKLPHSLLAGSGHLLTLANSY